MLLAVTDFITMLPEEKIWSRRLCAFAPLEMLPAGAVESTVSTVNDIIDEVAAARIGERGSC